MGTTTLTASQAAAKSSGVANTRHTKTLRNLRRTLLVRIADANQLSGFNGLIKAGMMLTQGTDPHHTTPQLFNFDHGGTLQGLSPFYHENQRFARADTHSAQVAAYRKKLSHSRVLKPLPKEAKQEERAR